MNSDGWGKGSVCEIYDADRSVRVCGSRAAVIAGFAEFVLATNKWRRAKAPDRARVQRFTAQRTSEPTVGLQRWRMRISCPKVATPSALTPTAAVEGGPPPPFPLERLDQKSKGKLQPYLPPPGEVAGAKMYWMGQLQGEGMACLDREKVTHTDRHTHARIIQLLKGSWPGLTGHVWPLKKKMGQQFEFPNH